MSTLSGKHRKSKTIVLHKRARPGSRTLVQHNGFRFAVFARQGGHPPNLENLDDLEVLSRTIARMHAVGARQSFSQRPQINAQRFGHDQSVAH